MKTNCWLILGTMLATTAVAQVNTNLPPIPAPAAPAPAVAAPAPAPAVTPAETSTNAPAKKTVKAKKKAKKAKSAIKTVAKKESELPSTPVTLVPGPATVAGENINLRGQAGLKGEVVGHAKKGDTVTVISEITLDKPKAGEPAQWAKIALPSDTKVWIDSKYVDKSNNTVTAKKLNLRGGPGENYSVLGVVEKGASVSTVTTKGDWMQIQPPANAFAFVAAGYLKQEAGMESNPVVPPPTIAATENVPPPAPQPVPPTPTTVNEAPTIAPPAANPPPTPENPGAVPPPPPTPAPEISNATPGATPGLPTPQPTLAPDETDTNLPPPPPRIVTHEGNVRHAVSPVAPTYFELFDAENDKAIDYLYTSSTNLNLARYDGLHITVTGEEALDARWKDTPVLTIQKIYVLSKPPKDKPIHPKK